MKEMLWYYLDQNKNPIPTKDPRDIDYDNRRVGHTQVGAMWVSTVFLGLDHNHFGEGPPILFETMVFGDKTHLTEDISMRYCTWQEAEIGHAEVVAGVTEQMEKVNKTLSKLTWLKTPSQ